LNGTERREKILTALHGAAGAISGGTLAKQLGVSRQVIVQDIALLRAGDEKILSTPKGYLLFESDQKLRRRFSVYHDFAGMEQELNIFVDAGARVLDVIVEHPVYGEIRGDLDLASRRDVRAFMNKIGQEKDAPLMRISGGLHQHTVEAPSVETLEEIREALQQAGMLREQ